MVTGSRCVGSNRVALSQPHCNRLHQQLRVSECKQQQFFRIRCCRRLEIIRTTIIWRRFLFSVQWTVFVKHYRPWRGTDSCSGLRETNRSSGSLRDASGGLLEKKNLSRHMDYWGTYSLRPPVFGAHDYSYSRRRVFHDFQSSQLGRK